MHHIGRHDTPTQPKSHTLAVVVAAGVVVVVHDLHERAQSCAMTGSWQDHCCRPETSQGILGQCI